MRALGEAATQLPWLSPCTASLVALARAPAPAAWEMVRGDPGAVLLIVRQTAASLAVPALSFFPALLRDPAILEGALRFLRAEARAATREPEREAGFVDWQQPALRPIYDASMSYARLAYRLAQMTGRADPDNAWVGGLLAPLGWLAVSAVDPAQAAACLADPALPQYPVQTQQRWWGLDQAGIARRLVQRWRLPRWLAALVSHLALPAEIGQTLGADPDLMRVVQLAVGLVQRHSGLHLPLGATLAELAGTLGISDAELAELDGQWLSPDAGIEVWQDPAQVPLLRDLLMLAADNLRWREAPIQEQRDRDFDQLHWALEEQRRGEASRLREQKLAALAELAAGAGHEINNPLAVISGQAQYLLGHEADPARQRALQTINGQTQRIHALLNDLMQFARPPRPQKQLIDVPYLVSDVTASLKELAVQRHVRLVGPQGLNGQPICLYADPRQIRTALTCLLRNAIEAAPAEGWAGIRLETPAPDRLDLVVEDSGTGPAPGQREHLFDPFYSGRHAGRGRGLGLPTAWRLAQEHGGEVRFDPRAEGPTRFVLSLPREASSTGNAA
jgi:two-component system NtrC family sensor kinase